MENTNLQTPSSISIPVESNPTTPITSQPLSSSAKKYLPIIVGLFLVIFGFLLGIIATRYLPMIGTSNTTPPNPIISVTPSLFPAGDVDETRTEEELAITQRQLSAGWYYGSEEQKLPGTPDSWIYKDGGKSSCWHKPGVECVSGDIVFACPASGWVDCMPTIGSIKAESCGDEAMAWYKENCPNFQGVAL